MNNPFPTWFYFSLPSEKRKITIDVRFTADDKEITPDEFDLVAYLVTNDFIKVYFGKPTIEITGTQLQLKYDEEKKLYLLIYAEKEEATNILFKLNKSKTNTKEYTSAVININTVSEFIAETLIPLKYLDTLIKGTTKITYLLEETCELCNYFEIDILRILNQLKIMTNTE